MSTPNPLEIGKSLAIDDVAGDMAARRALETELSHPGSHEPPIKPGAEDESLARSVKTIADEMTDDQVANMSIEELERHFGMDVPDRSTEAKGPATVSPELAAPAAAAVVEPAAVSTAAPALSTVAPAITAQPGERVDGVLARDGKHVLPYTVLEDSRNTIQTQAQRIRELEESNRTLAARGDAAAQAQQPIIADARSKSELGVLTDEELANLKSELPEHIYNAFAKQNETLSAIVNERQAVIANREQQEALQVQAAIDGNVTLAKWQNAYVANTDPHTFARAVSIDNAIKDLPQYAKMSLVERYADVVAMVEGKPLPSTLPRAAAPGTPTLTARADAILERARAKADQPQPFSHSDVPGGTPAAQSDAQLLDSMSTMDVEKLFAGKTDAQINALLAKAS